MGLFDTDFNSLMAGLFGHYPAPPVGVLLRILGLPEKPTSREAVKSAFRSRVMQVHPDLATYTDPGLRTAAEAVASATPEVQELVWARNALLRMIPEPVTDDQVERDRKHEPLRCKGCDGQRLDYFGKPYLIRCGRWRWDGYCDACVRDTANARYRERRAARRLRSCASCGATFTGSRSDARYCTPRCRQTAYRTRLSAVGGAT